MGKPIQQALPIAIADIRAFTSKVKSVKVDKYSKTLNFDNGISLPLHRFSCAGKGDTLKVKIKSGATEAFAICKNGNAKILPSFSSSSKLNGLNKRLTIKEIKTSKDQDDFVKLSRYHYRSSKGFGRRAVLIATYKPHGEQQKVVGYIEITNTFAGHKSRNLLFNAPFDDNHGVKWEAWDVAARKRFINTIARISRCVVHPEFRGVGIGVSLCKAAAKFCQNYWHISQLKPVFLEITADMLKFVPFAERAGMKYIGTTSGNIKRIRKDQLYLQKIFQEITDGVRDCESHAVFSTSAKSILKKQHTDVKRVKELADEYGLDVDDFLNSFLSSDDPASMTPTAYDLLSKLLRFPKPTYMIGLSSPAKAFLDKRLSEVSPEASPIPKFPKSDKRIPAIRIDSLTITYDHSLPKSPWANALKEAFGLENQVVTHTGIHELDLYIEPGEIIYVWGPSGSGKTGFLNALAGKSTNFSGKISGVNLNDLAIFSLVFADNPLIENFENLETALFALNLSGLSEASLYFKEPKMLSTGQNHRLGLAQLIASSKPIWIVDEFCSVLDDTTASIVARNFGQVARKVNATVVVAGPRRDPVIPALDPDRILTLDSLGFWTIEE